MPPILSYEDVLPLGLVNRVKSTLSPTNIALVQQLVNMVRKLDTSRLYRKRALAELEKYKPYLQDTEYEVFLSVVEWIVQNIDRVKSRKYGEIGKFDFKEYSKKYGTT